MSGSPWQISVQTADTNEKKAQVRSSRSGPSLGAEMTGITRREFNLLAAGASLAAVSELPGPALAAGPAKVVIIGGGPGGAAVANRLKSAAPEIDIALVEP